MKSLRDFCIKAGRLLKDGFSYLLIFFIEVYQFALSPYLGGNCRFYPSCSEYSKEAYQKYPLLKATYLVFRRLSRCHPWGDYGYDPVCVNDCSQRRGNSKTVSKPMQGDPLC